MAPDVKTLFEITEVELIYRNKVNRSDRRKITSSESSFDAFLLVWNMNKIELVEQFMILLLDRSNNCLGISNVSTGGLSSCLVDPKIIFATALKAKASGMVLAHNHPSGNLTPSNADIEFTKKIKQGGQLLDISIFDHLIISPKHYYSFGDEGMMP